MKKINYFLYIVVLFVTSRVLYGQEINDSKTQRTYCNPVNLSYRFCLDKPSRREAADPSIILFKDEYYMFASKSGGYWYSKNLLDWDLIETDDLPIEEYAPAAVVINDIVYFMASGEKSQVFKTVDPKSGKWEKVNPGFPYALTDPALFYDDDGRLYLYWGCSNKLPLYVIELDLKNNLQPIGKPKELFGVNAKEHGWEKQGDYNNLESSPWFEGAWMNKYNGKYYLQYAAPGTEFKSYADGYYISEDPLGPFVYQNSNPFSLKQGGFICGAGHGSTFRDKSGNYWHIATQTISVKHMFERRLGLFPAFFDKDGILYTETKWGDYPHHMYSGKMNSSEDSFTGWMLLSYNKNAKASSSIDSLPVSNTFDEEVRTYWSAESGSPGEWLEVDLGSKCRVNAVQVNFAENETSIFGRQPGLYYQYIVEYSNDELNWSMLIDKSKSTADLPHDYTGLKQPVYGRYIRLNNIHIPGGRFAVSDFRIFGEADKPLPKIVKDFTVERDPADARNVKLEWEKDSGATGYIINYGVEENKFYNHLMIYGNNSAYMQSLNTGADYFFSIDSFNEKGVTKGKQVKTVKAGQ